MAVIAPRAQSFLGINTYADGAAPKMEINILDLGGRRILAVTRGAIAGILNSRRALKR